MKPKKRRKNQTHKTIVLRNNQKQSWVIITSDGNVQCLQHYYRIFLSEKFLIQRSVILIDDFLTRISFCQKCILYQESKSKLTTCKKSSGFCRMGYDCSPQQDRIFHNSSTLLRICVWQFGMQQEKKSNTLNHSFSEELKTDLGRRWLQMVAYTEGVLFENFLFQFSWSKKKQQK